MFNLKKIITSLAYSAVNMAENALKEEDGQAKKQLAIEFVVNRLPIIQPFKSIVGVLMSKFIDEAIEQAVCYMNEIQNKTNERF